MSRSGRQLRRKKQRGARKALNHERRSQDAVMNAIGELHLRLQHLDEEEYPQKQELLLRTRELGAAYFSARAAAQMPADEMPVSNVPSMFVDGRDE